MALGKVILNLTEQIHPTCAERLFRAIGQVNFSRKIRDLSMPALFTVRIGRYALIATLLAALASPAWAGLGFRSAVGGVAINTKGVLTLQTKQANRELVEFMKDHVQPAEGEMNDASELRRVSLKKLAAIVADSAKNNYMLADDVRYLAGLQRVQYIFVYPEQNDIVLAGPGDGWKVTESGDVVGRTNGLPILQLDDLLVALRGSEQARQLGISCSIDPTEEGMRRMRTVGRKQGAFHPSVLAKLEQAMGPQQIKLTGIPADSHFARVLVAADYRMKRIAMQLEQSPLRELPSYLSMLKNSRVKVTNMMPRWWMACDYEPMARTEDGLGWELRGPGVKVMTEMDFVDSDGTRTASGKRSDLAQKWADAMTKNYEKLSKKSPVFGQLRNIMDLAIIAAVIDKHDLAEKAGCDLSVLTESSIDLGTWNAPKTVSTQCSVTKRGREYLVTASGGVQIESWQVAEKAEVKPALSTVYTKASMSSDSWWK